MKAHRALALFGVLALGTASCASVEGGPDGGVARGANDAEAFCQTIGRHATITGAVNSTGDLGFSCRPGSSGPVDATALYPSIAQDRCQADRGKNASIKWARNGVEFVGYNCVGGAPAPATARKAAAAVRKGA
jgi:hypothetical protein